MADKQPSRTRIMVEERRRGTVVGAAPETTTAPKPERLDARGLRRQTLYLPPEVYEQIRAITINDRISQQRFFREAIDCAFRGRGLKVWAELVPPKGK